MLHVDNLVKQYGKREALKGVSFHVNAGQIVGLLGENGAGKTTIMNIITGYLASDDGDVEINGLNILDKPIEAKQMLGYLPEKPPLYEKMSVSEYLEFVGELRGLEHLTIVREISELLKKLDMEKYKHTLICQLSKGYKQRVGFAQALMGKPPLVILDEPMVGLDPNQIVEMRELIRSMAGRQTVILSSHILSEIETICDKIIIIDDGRVVAEDTVKKLEEENTKNNILRVVVKGKKGDIHKILRETELVKRFQLLGEVESGVYEFQVVTESGTDVRDELFLLFAHNQMIVYSINTEQLSLEEVFRKVTNKEE